jgi:hypothetical protein
MRCLHSTRRRWNFWDAGPLPTLRAELTEMMWWYTGGAEGQFLALIAGFQKEETEISPPSRVHLNKRHLREEIASRRAKKAGLGLRSASKGKGS